MNNSAILKGGEFLRCVSGLFNARSIALSPSFGFQTIRSFSRGICPKSEKPMTSRLTGKKTNLWELYNEVIYPPRDTTAKDAEVPDPRPAEITYTKENILYSQKKLWLLAYMVRKE